MINGHNIFDQTVKNDMRTHENIWKIATGQEDDYTTVCLLDYPYFNELYKLIAIDLSEQQALDADPKAIQQISFTGNILRAKGVTSNNVFHHWRSERNHLRLFTRNSESTVNLFCFNIVSV